VVLREATGKAADSSDIAIAGAAEPGAKLIDVLVDMAAKETGKTPEEIRAKVHELLTEDEEEELEALDSLGEEEDAALDAAMEAGLVKPILTVDVPTKLK
jgi:hypothetical protein